MVPSNDLMSKIVFQARGRQYVRQLILQLMFLYVITIAVFVPSKLAKKCQFPREMENAFNTKKEIYKL